MTTPNELRQTQFPTLNIGWGHWPCGLVGSWELVERQTLAVVSRSHHQ